MRTFLNLLTKYFIIVLVFFLASFLSVPHGCCAILFQCEKIEDSTGSQRKQFFNGDTVNVTFLAHNTGDSLPVLVKMDVLDSLNQNLSIVQEVNEGDTVIDNNKSASFTLSFIIPIDAHPGVYNIRGSILNPNDGTIYSETESASKWNNSINVIAPADGISKYYAILVGTSSKEKDGTEEGEEEQTIAVNDINYVKNTLLSCGANWLSANIVSLLNKDAEEEAIKNQFASLSKKIDSDDIFLFYFVGHGSSSGIYTWSDKLYDPDEHVYDISLFLPNGAATVSVISACHSGLFVERFAEKGFSRNAVISSSKSDETEIVFSIFYRHPWDHSTFNYHFHSAIDGGADNNSDQKVTLKEAYDYLSWRVVLGTLTLSEPQNYIPAGLQNLVLTDESKAIENLPSINLTSPYSDIVKTVGQPVRIQWGDNDSDDTAHVSIAYDVNDVEHPWVIGDHSWIDYNISEDNDGEHDIIYWDTTSVAPGTYTIWGMIYDGAETTRFSRAVGKVILQNSDDNSNAGSLPIVQNFSLNQGDDHTTDRNVVINITAINTPTHYIASENPVFTGSEWKIFESTANFTLSSGYGPKRVYLKLRNDEGESNAISASILYTATNESGKLLINQSTTPSAIPLTLFDNGNSSGTIHVKNNGNTSAIVTATAALGNHVNLSITSTNSFTIPAGEVRSVSYHISCGNAPEGTMDSANIGLVSNVGNVTQYFSVKYADANQLGPVTIDLPGNTYVTPTSPYRAQVNLSSYSNAIENGLDYAKVYFTIDSIQDSGGDSMVAGYVQDWAGSSIVLTNSRAKQDDLPEKLNSKINRDHFTSHSDDLKIQIVGQPGESYHISKAYLKFECFTGDPKLVASKSASNTSPAVGDNITITINLNNEGINVADDISFDDSQLPDGLSFVSGIISNTNLSNLDPEETDSISYVLRVTKAGEFTLAPSIFNYENYSGESFSESTNPVHISAYNEQTTLSMLASPPEAGMLYVEPDKPFYSYQEIVEIVGQANVGYSLSGWSEDNCSGSICSVTMDNHKTVSAYFTPASTLLIVPASAMDGTFTISWSTSGGATSYDLQEATDSKFTENLTSVYSGENHSTLISNNEGTYYYRVRPVYNGINAPWSYGSNPCIVTKPTHRIIQLSGDLSFGDVIIGQSTQKTIAISNSGNSPLSISSITYPIGFSGAWSGTIPAGATQNITVTFSPLHIQTHGGTIIINSNKTSGTFTQSCSGAGIDVIQPEINIVQGGTEVADGTGSVDFGNTNIGSNSALSFNIENLGNSPLALSGNPIVQIGGINASDFSVTQQPATPITKSGFIQFVINFNPSAEGTRNATVSILNNDQDENPYNFSIHGNGLDVVPIISSMLNESIVEGIVYTSPTPAFFQGTLPVTWTLVSNIAGMTIDSNTGVVSWANPTVTGSPHTVTIRATNSAGYDDESWILTINKAPLIDTIANESINEGDSYTGPTPTLSQGTQPVTWTLVSNIEGMTIDSNTGVVIWENPIAEGSPHTFTIRATNSAGYDDESWALTLKRPPIIGSISNDSINEDNSYASPRPILSQGSLPVTWSLVSSIEGMVINSNTGVVSWENPTNERSPHMITIGATNSAGYDEEQWQLTVEASSSLQRVDVNGDNKIGIEEIMYIIQKLSKRR